MTRKADLRDIAYRHILQMNSLLHDILLQMKNLRCCFEWVWLNYLLSFLGLILIDNQCLVYAKATQGTDAHYGEFPLRVCR